MAIRIDSGGSRKPAERSAVIDTSTGTQRVQPSTETAFGHQLGRTLHGVHEERLLQLAREVETQGKRLADRVDIPELKAYKRLVSTFLEEAVAGFGKFSKESFLDRRGRHRVYATVKIVNEKMEELTREVLKTEKDNLAIAGRIEDIRGLVLDLFL